MNSKLPAPWFHWLPAMLLLVLPGCALFPQPGIEPVATESAPELVVAEPPPPARVAILYSDAVDRFAQIAVEITGRDSVTNRETVEVAHEALLREWPRLREWIASRHEALRLRDKVADEARIWVGEGRPDARRWRHELLDRARRLLADADLLAMMEGERDVADFLIPEAEWLLAELLCSGTDHLRREVIGLRLSEMS